MSSNLPPGLTNYTYLSIQCEEPLNNVFLEPTYNGELWDGEYPYYFTIQGYGTSDDGNSVPSLPAGVTFNTTTSELSGIVNSYTLSNVGNFLVTVWTDVSYCCWFTIVNIDYNNYGTSYT